MSTLLRLFQLWDLVSLAGFPLLLAVHLRLHQRHARGVELLRECDEHLKHCRKAGGVA